MIGKAKLFKSRKDLDGQFHRGNGGRRAEKARKHKRSIEKSLRQKSRILIERELMTEKFTSVPPTISKLL